MDLADYQVGEVKLVVCPVSHLDPFLKFVLYHFPIYRLSLSFIPLYPPQHICIYPTWAFMFWPISNLTFLALFIQRSVTMHDPPENGMNSPRTQ